MIEQITKPKITNLQDSDLVRYIRAHKNPTGVSEDLRRFYTEYQTEADTKKYSSN